MKKATQVILVVVAILAIGYDVIVAVNSERGDTISEVMLTWSMYLPFIAVVFGYLTGHLFWPRPKHIEFWVSMTVLLGLIATWQILAIWYQFWPIIPFIVCVPFGYLFWPQNRNYKFWSKRK